MIIPNIFLKAVSSQGWDDESQVIVLLQIIDDYRRIGLFTNDDFQKSIENKIAQENADLSSHEIYG